MLTASFFLNQHLLAFHLSSGIKHGVPIRLNNDHLLHLNWQTTNRQKKVLLVQLINSMFLNIRKGFGRHKFYLAHTLLSKNGDGKGVHTNYSNAYLKILQ